MKEVTRISLAQLPYNIEVAAKKELEKYLHAVETSLGADTDAMREIESRIVEILADHGTSGERVITLENVDTVKTQLGDPKEFISDEVVSELTKQTATEKRLMRDTHHALLGGVCAGLGAYFRIDTVLVRLIFIVLVIVTSGAALLAYLISWIVIPPARSAAERLQMAGKPVTLEALQEESIVVSADKADSRIVLTMLRIMAGIASIVLGLSALMGMMVGGWRVWGMTDRLSEYGYWLPLGAFVIAGILFVVLCGITAHALFTAKLTKKTMITGSVIIALGLVGAVIGGGGFALLADRDGARLTVNSHTKQVAVSEDLMGTTSLVVDARSGMEVQYTVTAEKPHAELRYSTLFETTEPSVRLTASGSSTEIIVEGQQCQGMAMGCSLPATLVVYGPALSQVEVKNGGLLYTMHEAQASLSVVLHQTAAFDLVGDSQITRLTIDAQEGAVLNASNANVRSVTANLLSGSNTAFGSLADASLRVPESCGVERRTNVTLSSVGHLEVNGAIVDMTKDSVKRMPCASIVAEPAAD